MNSNNSNTDANMVPKHKYKYKLTELNKSMIGTCDECNGPRTYFGWCRPCNAKHFQQDFNKWTSGDKKVDEFIQQFQLTAIRKEEILEWIPYERFENIEYLAEGGFGKVYKAKWIDDGPISKWNNKWQRESRFGKVVLKSLNSSHNLTAEFLQEIANHKKMTDGHVVRCFGISRDPITKNFIMVMEYIPMGNIRQFLRNNDEEYSLCEKLELFISLTNGLRGIHDEGLIHKDLHSGNILNYSKLECYISDLGLCKPANEKTEKKIYGVLPYVAPEVLKNKTYTQPADIYSFGILAYEIFSELPAYHNLPHDSFLALKICQGLRPKFVNIKIPPLIANLIDRCLDADPSKRPEADELYDIFDNWFLDVINERDTEIYRQCKEAEEFNKSKSNNSLNNSSFDEQGIYYSRQLDYNDLPKPQNSKEINNQFYDTSEYSDLLELQI